MVIEHANLIIKKDLINDFVQTIYHVFAILSSSEG